MGKTLKTQKVKTPKRQNKGEELSEKKARVKKIIAALKKLYPDATCALHHANPFQLLVSVILSAQSTDETINKVTPTLFARYATPEKMAKADQDELEKLIYASGFFRQKAKSLIGTSQMIVDEFNGQVPDTMESLLRLRGVARKTANVVLGTWFGKNEGFVVDTHVGRLSHRLGLTWSSKHEKDAVAIEKDLMQIVPRDEWTYLGHALIWHGRRICTARKPKCGECTLNKLCPAAFTFDDNGANR